ncbi:TetM/TetW/TetO/TetS family tetracycline resistance ribosomal protection protein [Kitasatospora sp. NBC_01250]|uniref:translation factor GTPase family protein n=1 Tax=Kitasatospora sp. NBC_01250 TaxID=2903571 RepID=UPI002E350413|nr:translation factor GTPase family protein [Kitasatospora sp. NBC_01250]
MHMLNLGILAHIDAGKTSLTERLLHAAGVVDELGSVDDGSTRTDSLALERQRGITIKAAVVSFAVRGATVNLIDTPGHPDFIAEVERVLGVLDGAVLVVSAVEGVQAQTRVLMRTLERLRIPTLLFVNKIDRRGADRDRVLREIAERLTPALVPLGSVTGSGTRAAAYAPYADSDPAFTAALVDRLAEQDDEFLAAYLADEAKASAGGQLRRRLAALTSRGLLHPVLFGSAITGAGIDALLTGIATLLPAAGVDAEGEPSGTVFKVERGPAGEKIAYVRMFAGTVRTRDQVGFGAGDDRRAGKVTAVELFEDGSCVRADALAAGRIGRLRGLGEVRVGDPLGAHPGPAGEQRHFAPPTLETVVVPRDGAGRAAVHLALAQLAEQDPLINLRQDDLRGEVSVSLYGEVQKEVIQATLADEYGVAVDFRETTTICVERLCGAGSAVEVIAKPPNPFLATVGLRVEPGPPDSGVRFELAVELGSLPLAFIKTVEESVSRTLTQGLHGWQVLDCTVTMTHSGYWARQSHAHGTFDASMSSTAGDFRHLTPLVLMAALRQAGTTVHEPVHRFRLELPNDAYGPVLPLLTRLGALPHAPVPHGAGCLLEGEIPAAAVHRLEQRLPGLTRGEAVLEYAFERYRPVRGATPERARTDHNPLDRKEYLLHVQRRV